MQTLAALVDALAGQYAEFSVDTLSPAVCTHEHLQPELARLLSDGRGLIVREEIGRSIEGRSIAAFSLGTGPRSVMLWSQMHGDESTATLALLDILQCFVRWRAREWVAEILGSLTLHLMPMLNPDGAALRTRQNAVGIDINRDARAAVSPEAQALLAFHQRRRPQFGFNLHDQELRSSGDTPHPAALAFLAPAADPDRSLSAVRKRAMCVGARITSALAPLAEGRMTRYDDAHEPRAFGDYFQGGGTSTLLIESGHWPGDPDKTVIRKLNTLALIAAFRCIGQDGCNDGIVDAYLALPPNGYRMFDLLVKGVRVQHPNGWSGPADLGILFERDGIHATVKEVGDLRLFGGLETRMGNDRILPPVLARANTSVERSVIADFLLSA